jgi:uncharacterized membrane protein YbhN (UPF0104 family)
MTAIPDRVKRQMGAGAIERALLAGGIVLFCVLLYRLGGKDVLTSLRIVGWGILLIVLQDILAVAANTAGWRAAFALPRPSIPFPTLLTARIVGDALNYLTPTATLGGEFARTRMLKPYAPATSVVASVTVAKVTQALGLLAFLIVGLASVVDHARLAPALRWGLMTMLGLFATGLTVLLVVQRHGLFGVVVRRLMGWPILNRLGHLHPALDRLDREVANTLRESPGMVVVSSALFCLGWTLGVVESYLVLHFLELPVSLEQAFAVEVLGVAFNNALFFFVPLRAGTQEAGKILAFTAAGFDPVQGLAGGILCRIRELFWALFGLALFYRYRRSADAGTVASGR